MNAPGLASVAPATDQGAVMYPPYMGELVHRAAALLQVRRMSQKAVPFTWWADGENQNYLASWDWPFNADGPRTLVFNAYTGDLACASMPGRMWDIDPATVNVQSFGIDEIDRDEWKARQRGQRRT